MQFDNWYIRTETAQIKQHTSTAPQKKYDELFTHATTPKLIKPGRNDTCIHSEESPLFEAFDV